MPLKLHRNEPDRALVELEGPFDWQTGPEIRKSLLKIARARGVRKVEVDLTQVSKIDTAGVAVLVELLRCLSHKGGELFLKGVNENVGRMIQLARLDEVFERK